MCKTGCVEKTEDFSFIMHSKHRKYDTSTKVKRERECVWWGQSGGRERKRMNENHSQLGCINKSISSTMRKVIVLLYSALRIMFRFKGLILKLEKRGYHP